MIYYHYILGGLLLKLGFPLSAKPQGVGGQDWNQWTDVSNYNMLFSVPTNISVNTRVSDYI